MKNNNKGFSLVELIVVIAIMAILAAVAVVGVSVYIPKAQQASDKQMVADIEYVLNLHAQSTPEDVTAGYIILTPNGAQASEGFATAVLEATYGEDWANELKLAYGEWTNDGLLNLVANYTEDELDLIANSTFISVSTPEGMMNAVTNMTGIVSDVIAGTDLSQANDRLNTLLGDGNNVVSTLENLNVDYSDDDYSTIVSNLLVKNMADGMQSDAADSDLVALLTMYSTVYAYAEKNNDDTLLKEFDTALENLSYQTLIDEGACSYCESVLENNASWADYVEFAQNSEDTDVAALQNMMGAVSQISGSYTDRESLSNSNLYSSDAVGQQVDNYVNSVKSLANLSDAERATLKGMPANSVAILIAEDGTVSVVPEAAWSRS